MYENKLMPLATRAVFYWRTIKHAMFGFFMIGLCLLIGIFGYHFTDNIPWIDSIHNASMILGGMGPVVEIKSNAGKIFSSFYALFCGVMFITSIGVILAPTVHRFFHIIHMDEVEDPIDEII
jgi:hypothetical protein